MFMQVELGASAQGGLGLGLTLARTLIERHDGHITVQSEGLGRGAEFSVGLPALSWVPESVGPSFQNGGAGDGRSQARARRR